MEYRITGRGFQTWLSMPVIWSLIIPLVIFDFWIEIYHRICFPLYGMPYVKRSEYIKIDRHRLKYLAWYEKLGCAYCGYANGLAHYWSVIAARTECYFCAIRHRKYKKFKQPKHHKGFLQYGDEKTFKKKYT